MAPLGHHELVAFGIHTHGEVQRILGGIGRLGNEAATALDEPGNPRAQVVELERQPSPRAFAFAAAVDANGGSRDDDFAPGFARERDLATEELLIEIQATPPVGRPQDIFNFFNFHERGAVQTIISR